MGCTIKPVTTVGLSVSTTEGSAIPAPMAGAGELRTRRVGSEAEPAGAYAALEPPPRLRTQRWTSARSRSAGNGLGRMLQGVAMPSSESAAVA